MTTTARWRALRWFADHAADINGVAGQRMPSKRMRNQMIKDGQLGRSPVGSFNHHRFELTAEGIQLLASKHKKRKREVEADAEAHAT